MAWFSLPFFHIVMSYFTVGGVFAGVIVVAVVVIVVV